MPRGQKIGDAWVAIHGDGEGLRMDVKDALDDADDDFKEAGDRHGKQYTDSFGERMDRLNKKLSTFGDRMGAAFGRGGRNDFIHAIGGFARLLALIPRGISGLATSLYRFGRIGYDAFTMARTAGDGFFTSLIRGGAAMGGVVARGLAGLTAGVAGLFAIVGPLLSTITLLVGALTAMASSITMGAIGALGALAGAMLPVIAGVGIMVAAFKNAPPEAKRALDSIKREFSGLGDVAGRSVFANITEQAQRFRGVIGNLTPVVRQVGLAISRVGDYWLDMMEGPGFIQFRNAMEDFLPGAVESLGRSLANAFGGFGGLLRGLIPLTTRFLDWLERTTATFNRFTNSEEGQRKIITFFEKAGDSAAALGGFLGDVWDLLGTIITAGSGPGNSIFDSMGRAVQRWNQTLKDNPAILRDFFDDAVKFAGAIGRLITGVGRLWDVLDNSATRDAVVFAFESIARVVETLARLLGPLVRGFSALDQATGGLAGSLAAAALIFPRFNRAISGALGTAAGGGLMGMVGGLRDSTRRMALLSTAARGAAGIGGIALLASSSDKSSRAMQSMSKIGGGAMLGFSIGGPIGGAIGAGAGALLALATNTRKVEESMKQVDPPTKDFASTLKGLTADATRATREMAFLALSEDEVGTSGKTVADMANELGLSMRTLSQATTGNENAMAQITAQMERMRDSGKLSYNDFVQLQGAINHTSKEYLEQKNAALDLYRATTPLKMLYEDFPKDVITAIRANTTPGGVDTFMEVVRLQKQYDLTPKQVETLLRVGGVEENVQQVNAYATRLKGVPKTLKTYIVQQNLNVSMKGIRDYTKSLNLTPKQLRTVLRVNNGPAKAEVKFMQNYLRRWEREKNEAKLDLDSKPAKKEVGAIEKLIKTIPGVPKSVIAKITGDTKDAESKTEKTGDKVKTLVRGKYEVKVTGENGQALNAIDAVAARMRALDSYKSVTINTHYTTSGSRTPPTASGGMFSSPQVRLIGEAGPEAVVPLNRPLSQVDPAVRWLSAIAQGKAFSGGGKTVDASGWTIVSPGASPEQVAQETLNRLLAQTF